MTDQRAADAHELLDTLTDPERDQLLSNVYTRRAQPMATPASVTVGTANHRALKLLDQLDLPPDVRDSIDTAIADCQKVTTSVSKINDPDTMQRRLVDTLKAGTKIDTGALASLAARAHLEKAIDVARTETINALAHVIEDHADTIVDTAEHQWFTPAATALTVLAHWWRGETIGQLFADGRNDRAEQLRNAEQQHRHIVDAIELRTYLYGNDRTAFGPLGTWRYHPDLNTPHRDKYGYVDGPWTTTPDARAAKDFRTCVELLAEGMTLWLPTLDAATAAHDELVDQFNTEGAEAKEKSLRYVKSPRVSYS